MKQYGIRRGYVPREEPGYCDNTFAGLIYQPQVYELAVKYARDLGKTWLVDVGCGQAHKLRDYIGEFNVLGIDYRTNIDYCRKHFPDGVWLECDLEIEVPTVGEELLRESVVICADVIEHLKNPERLIAILRWMLMYSGIVILSTPDRKRVYGFDHNGPPHNPTHVREWTFEEFVAWLVAKRLPIAETLITLADNERRLMQTTTVVLKR